jgi:hypothetical protein
LLVPEALVAPGEKVLSLMRITEPLAQQVASVAQADFSLAELVEQALAEPSG